MIDRIIPEERPADRENMEELAQNLKSRVLEFFESCRDKTSDELCRQRYERFRRIQDGK